MLYNVKFLLYNEANQLYVYIYMYVYISIYIWKSFLLDFPPTPASHASRLVLIL